MTSLKFLHFLITGVTAFMASSNNIDNSIDNRSPGSFGDLMSKFGGSVRRSRAPDSELREGNIVRITNDRIRQDYIRDYALEVQDPQGEITNIETVEGGGKRATVMLCTNNEGREMVYITLDHLARIANSTVTGSSRNSSNSTTTVTVTTNTGFLAPTRARNSATPAAISASHSVTASVAEVPEPVPEPAEPEALPTLDVGKTPLKDLMPAEYRRDKQTIIKCLNRNGCALNIHQIPAGPVANRMLADYEVNTAALSKTALEGIDKGRIHRIVQKCRNREALLEFLQHDTVNGPSCFVNALSSEFRSDRAFAAAIAHADWPQLFAGSSPMVTTVRSEIERNFKNNRDFALYAVRCAAEAQALKVLRNLSRYGGTNFFEVEEIVLAAINSESRRYAGSSPSCGAKILGCDELKDSLLRGNPNVVLKAVQSNPFALEFADLEGISSVNPDDHTVLLAIIKTAIEGDLRTIKFLNPPYTGLDVRNFESVLEFIKQTVASNPLRVLAITAANNYDEQQLLDIPEERTNVFIQNIPEVIRAAVEAENRNGWQLFLPENAHLLSLLPNILDPRNKFREYLINVKYPGSRGLDYDSCLRDIRDSIGGNDLTKLRGHVNYDLYHSLRRAGPTQHERVSERYHQGEELIRSDGNIILAAVVQSAGKLYPKLDEAFRRDREISRAALSLLSNLRCCLCQETVLEFAEAATTRSSAASRFTVLDLSPEVYKQRPEVILAYLPRNVSDSKTTKSLSNCIAPQIMRQRDFVLAALRQKKAFWIMEALLDMDSKARDEEKKRFTQFRYSTPPRSFDDATFQSPCDDVMKDTEIMKLVCAHDAGALYRFGKLFGIQHNKEVVLASVTANGGTLRYASRGLRSDREVVLASVTRSGACLEFASDDLRDDREIVTKAISGCSSAVKYASQRLRSDKEVVMTAVTQCGSNLVFASDSLKADRDVVLAAIARSSGSDALKYASLQDDRETVLAAVFKCGNSLEHASARLKNDAEVVLAAVSENPDALRYASEEMKDTREILLASISKCVDSFRLYASSNLKGDKDVVLAAVSKRADALQYASSSLKNDRDIAERAIRKSDIALKYVSPALQGDEEFVKVALASGPDSNARSFEFASHRLKSSKEFIERITLGAEPWVRFRALQFMSEDLKGNEEFMRALGEKKFSSPNEPETEDERSFFCQQINVNTQGLESLVKKYLPPISATGSARYEINSKHIVFHS